MDVNYSIKDIARLAGVSVATVARALKGKPDINRETSDRVLAIAKRYNYQPNLLARGLVTQKTFTVGIIVPAIDNPFFPALIRGIEATLWESRYNVILSDTGYDPAKEEAALREFRSRRVDGVIISPINKIAVSPWLAEVAASAFPMVFLTRTDYPGANAVFADDRGGAHAITRHLLSLGYRRIVYLGNRMSAWANEERITGYTNALSEAGVGLEGTLIRLSEGNSSESACACTREVLAEGLRADAIFSFDDIMAIGVKRALAEAGLQVPRDIALVGFDNIDIISLPEIDLTTVDIPKRELGIEAARLLIDLIGRTRDGDRTDRRGAVAPKTVILDTTLVIRGSCGSRLRRGS
ncbi:MAG TPA: LacI family DNA-binding transcriptional regulator [Spirochaetia bacterium]|nr:LacI family DNA-binding transcriptional regulator [Spirochaetia bacterium]